MNTKSTRSNKIYNYSNKTISLLQISNCYPNLQFEAQRACVKTEFKRLF